MHAGHIKRGIGERAWRARGGWIPAVLGILAAGCGVDVHDGVGPRIPMPNVRGTITRQSGGADDVDVELRDAATAEVIAETQTDPDGAFTFADIPAGRWEVKASGEEEGDFDSISWQFDLGGADSTAVIPDLDLHAYAARLDDPPADVRMDSPTPFQPVQFRFTLPEAMRLLEWARVQCFRSQGSTVWESTKATANEVTWNGVASEGDDAGRLIPAGEYYWRVKVRFSDGMEARLERRNLIFE